jgi:putative flippase GtrA
MYTPSSGDSARTVPILKYLIVGGINTVFGIGVIFCCKYFLALSDIFSNAVGYAAGTLASFLLNAKWTFRFQGPLHVAVPRFVAVMSLAYVANLATVLACIRDVNVNSYLAHVIGLVPYVAVGYLGSRYFAFRPLRRG